MNVSLKIINQHKEKFCESLVFFTNYINNESWLDENALYTENEARIQASYYNGAHSVCIQLVSDAMTSRLRGNLI